MFSVANTLDIGSSEETGSNSSFVDYRHKPEYSILLILLGLNLIISHKLYEELGEERGDEKMTSTTEIFNRDLFHDAEQKSRHPDSGQI